MSDVRVLVTTRTKVPEEILGKIREVSPRVAVEPRGGSGLGQSDDLWRDVEVLYTDDLLPPPGSAPQLRWVQGHYAGVDRWGRRPFTERIIWTTTSGIHAPQVSELALTMMLAFARKLRLILDCQQKAVWPAERLALFTPYELRESTVGVVGYGNIGRQIGALCRAFGMRVLAADRPEVLTTQPAWLLPGLPAPADALPDRLYEPNDLASLLEESDYVVLCVPYTAQTRGLIDAEALACMRPNAVLINVARGGVIDEAALIDALKTERIRGAALDVFSEEPLPPTSPFWTLPNVIVSPHVAGFSPHYIARAMTFFAENLRRYLARGPLLNVVDKERGY